MFFISTQIKAYKYYRIISYLIFNIYTKSCIQFIYQYYTHNMDYQWVDVTQELTAIHKDFKMLELIKSDQITLEDCMQAQEIDDEKMDPKFDISHQHTIAYKLQHKLIKLPHQLTLNQIANVFANIFQLQACTLQGQPLSSSIYNFSYLYDRKICQDSPLFNALIQSIHCIGFHVYDLIKQAGTVKEDDVSISGFAFSNNKKSHEEVSQLLLQAEKKFETQFKKNQDKVSYNFILNSLRLRRSIHAFAKSSGIFFDPKNLKKIQTDLQSAKKKIVALSQIKFQPKQGLLPGVFLSDLYKTLKVHFGPRPLKLLSLEKSYEQIKNALEQIQLFLPVPTKVSQMRNKILILQSKPYNGWGKSYVKANIFAKQNYFFSTVNTQQALIADIDDWIHLKGDVIKQNQKFINLIRTGASVINETLYRLEGNSMRWQWECSKVYEDYNILIHMANEVDGIVGAGSKEFYISSWFYYHGLQLMALQMLIGFQNNLYQKNQLKYVFFVFENILGVIGRNSQVFLRKLDKSILQNFNEGNFNKKIKKKMNEDQQLMFSNVIFKKGLHLYFRALINIITVLHHRKLLENKFEQTEQIRIKNRFRIFKNVLFTKIIDYKQYKNTIEQICKREGEFLNQALEELKQVKNIFKLFTTQLDDSETFFRQKEDAQILMKLSVKASVIVMTLKMNATANKKFGVDLSGRFPDFTMQ